MRASRSGNEAAAGASGVPVLRRSGKRLSNVLALSVGWVLLVAAGAEPGARSAPKPIRITSIEQAISLLGDARFIVREEAMRWLWHQGAKAAGPLREASQDADRERAMRAQVLLERLAMGIQPDTPADIARILRTYQKGNSAAKLSALKELAGRDRIEQAAELVAIAYRKGESWVVVQAENVLPLLVYHGRIDLADEVLRAAAKESSTAAGSLRAWQRVEGRLDEAIRADQAKLGREAAADAQTTRRLLHHVLNLRAAGRLDEAIAAAEQSKGFNDRVLRVLLMERGDWKRLLQIVATETAQAVPAEQSDRDLGLHAAIALEAGDDAAYEKALKELLERIDKKKGGRNAAMRVLAVLGAYDRVVERAAKDKDFVYFSVISELERWDDALAWLGISKPGDTIKPWAAKVLARMSEQPNQFNSVLAEVDQVCTVLVRLGWRDQATDLLDQVADRAAREFASPDRVLRQLIPLEIRLGLNDLAFRHAGDMGLNGPNSDQVLRSLFGDSWATARFWWNAFRTKAPKESKRETLARVRRVIEVKWDRTDLKKLVRDQLTRLKTASASARKLGYRQLNETLVQYGMWDLAAELWEQCPEDEVDHVAWADVLMRAQRWSDAAAHYAKAVSYDNAVTIYLRGIALRRCGKRKEGDAEIRRAQLLAVFPRASYTMAASLEQRGWRKEAVQQWLLLLETTEPEQGYYRSVLRRIWDTDLAEFVPARLRAHAYRSYLWNYLNASGSTFSVFYHYLNYRLRHAQAGAYLDRGDVDSAIREMKRALKLNPAGIEIGEDYVPRLEKLGRKTDAEELFTTLDRFMSNMCRRFPQSSLYNNNLAWLYARCNRKLDEAERLVRRAVEQEPESATYLDTLAEILFRKGDVDEAIRIAKRCIQLDPEHFHYQRQLARFLLAKE